MNSIFTDNSSSDDFREWAGALLESAGSLFEKRMIADAMNQSMRDDEPWQTEDEIQEYGDKHGK